MNTLGLALRDALEARQRHALYNDGPRFLNRRHRGGLHVHSDAAIIQMASAVAPCSYDLTRAAAISHILHATLAPDSRS